MKIILTEKQIDKLVTLLSEQGFIDRVTGKIKSFFSNEECSTKFTKNAKSWKDVYSILLKNNKIKKNEPLLIVWGPTQTLFYTNNGVSLTRQYKISTGANGFGSSSNSFLTNPGLMKVSDKIKSPKKYQVLVGKRPINSVLGPNIDSTRKDEEGHLHKAEVLTGILVLQGYEECNKNVFSRGIYIHGTN